MLTEGYQTYTYSDDFSYYAAGVPSTVNGFLLQKDMEHVHPFYIDYYHTQYDTPDTYNDAVMAFNLRYYGALAIYIDQMPALQLDFTAQRYTPGKMRWMRTSSHSPARMLLCTAPLSNPFCRPHRH